MWLVSMLIRQPAVLGVRACSSASARHILSRCPAVVASATPAVEAATVLTETSNSLKPQQAQNVPANMAAEAIADVDMAVTVAAGTESGHNFNATKQFLLQANAAAAVACPLTHTDLEVQSAANLQEQQQQQQQAELYDTQLLVIDAASLPPAAPLDATEAQRLLSSSAAAVDLSRGACPHLFYTLPESWQQQHDNCSNSSAAPMSAPVQQQHTSSSTTCVPAALTTAAQLLREGYPVAIPTETVYGLAGNALSDTAVASIFAAKGRPADNPLIVHISDLDMLAGLYHETEAAENDTFSFIPQQYHKLIAAFWPGPLTILLPASPRISTAVTAGLTTMAVRMPAHPVARALIAAAGVPLAAPSANTSGKPSPTTAQHVIEDLAGKVPAVVDGGGCGFGVESTVLDGLRTPPVVLRPGGVTAESLMLAPDMADLQVYSRDFTDKTLEATPTTPGMKYRHYSPTAPVLLLDPTPAWQQQQQQRQVSTLQLEQQMVEATQNLLQQLQQNWLQDTTCAGIAAASATQGQRQRQRQRVVLLRTCCSSSSRRQCCSSSSTSEQQLAVVGWTPESLARLHATQQQQQGLLQANQASDYLSAQYNGSGRSSSSSSSDCIEVLEYVLGSWQQPDVIAQQLFLGLREADRVAAQLIVVQGVVPHGAGLAVMNRLQKAASDRIAVGL